MSTIIDCSIVPAIGENQAFLWQALYYAAHMDEEPSTLPESARTDPPLAPYVAGWGERAGDLGFLAVASNGSTAGSAWLSPRIGALSSRREQYPRTSHCGAA